MLVEIFLTFSINILTSMIIKSRSIFAQKKYKERLVEPIFYFIFFFIRHFILFSISEDRFKFKFNGKMVTSDQNC